MGRGTRRAHGATRVRIHAQLLGPLPLCSAQPTKHDTHKTHTKARKGLAELTLCVHVCAATSHADPAAPILLAVAARAIITAWVPHERPHSGPLSGIKICVVAAAHTPDGRLSAACTRAAPARWEQ